jgi:DNA polymerase elongation subunit (family B)
MNRGLTLTASAGLKTRLDRIESYRPEVQNSASFDFEWIPYEGMYQHQKTHIFEAGFCTNWGERIVLNISHYASSPNPEEVLLEAILFYLNQFPLTFGWYSTGVEVYDEMTGQRIKGRNSDLFTLHQRCIFHGLDSPVELKRTYARFKDPNKKHIDLCKIFENPTVQTNLFDGKYRATDLDSVSRALLGIGKYGKLNAGTDDISSLPVEEQMRYVKRDTELTMRLAQHQDCIALRMMKVFAGYAQMDYYLTCHTRVSWWYANKYQQMLNSGECTISFTPNFKLAKQDIGGGEHILPAKGFFAGIKIYELDIQSLYPSVAIKDNLSFDTLNCTCCEQDASARGRQKTIEEINQILKEKGLTRRVDKYWVCQQIGQGAYPKVLQLALSDRAKYKKLLKEEKVKTNPDPRLIEEYDARQIGAKIFANAGYGVFGNPGFKFANYQVAECITAEGRRILKQMEQMAKNDPYNFEVVFGFTDSVFFKPSDAGIETDGIVDNFIQDCETKFGVTPEKKKVFVNSILYGKKNRFVGWTGNQNDEPVIKLPDVLSAANPLWALRWLERIIVELVKHPQTRFEVIPKMIKEAFDELDSGRIDLEEELKFTHKLSKEPHEYKNNARVATLAETLGKGKGELVHYYETHDRGGYSTRLENVNLQKYKNFLMDKLEDSLQITGFDVVALKHELLEPHIGRMTMFLSFAPRKPTPFTGSHH